jgi:2-polyprenyl-6-methoxyphenol hydroxylase-like FAD-dependent oxidoreductase
MPEAANTGTRLRRCRQKLPAPASPELTAAIALRQRGRSVRVHEKEAALRAFGAGTFIWENGLHVPHAFGAYDDGRSSGGGLRVTVQWPACRLRESKWGQPLSTTDHDAPASLYCNPCCGKAGRVEIVTRSPAVAAQPEGIVQLADGRRLPAELVIAADGVRSCIRNSLSLAGKRRKYQDGIIRVLLENTDLIGGEVEPCNRLLGLRTPDAAYPLRTLRGRATLFWHDGRRRCPLIRPSGAVAFQPLPPR